MIMAARLGNVLYWFFCTIAIVGVVGVYFAAQPKNMSDWQTAATVAAVIAIPAFLIGRALRYILAAR
jgi:hypothetical protein